MRSAVNINDHRIFFTGIEVYRFYQSTIKVSPIFCIQSENFHIAKIILVQNFIFLFYNPQLFSLMVKKFNYPAVFGAAITVDKEFAIFTYVG